MDIDGLEILLENQHISELKQAYIGDMTWAILRNVYALGGNGNQCSVRSYTDFCGDLENLANPSGETPQTLADNVIGMFDKYEQKGDDADAAV